MASPATALFLPLTLLLQVAAAFRQSQFRMSPSKLEVRPGESVKLSCEVLLPNAGSTCSWVFQPREVGASPIFLLYIGANGLTRLASDLDREEISGGREREKVFVLNLNKFQEKNQGYYFCSVVGSPDLHFSPYIPVFLPAKPTTRPTPRPTTRARITELQPRTPRPEFCRPSGGAVGDSKGLDLTCDIYIWAPLAGTCAVLLLSLIITIICNRRKPRRVCKCPRPVVRPGGKTNKSDGIV
ncbi:T-cell surface glycoprotein CD8 alpha chain [Ochotona curzoniae]|uniref:T-cell surface glycoprotein CD8 alpha chain n=1 Tax=Ochotona curzoniae TaxID=130825 RepID=UPI001B3520CF|nr:T-cell surface glycoprotein CD8 alpha chain [Ochotona curzoniae]